jgi:hypothetical protein
MANEVLQEAVKKAQANGWCGTWKNGVSPGYEKVVLFNHEFAKALWGEEVRDMKFWSGEGDKLHVVMPEWKANLMLMAISEDPLKYLEMHIREHADDA